MDSGLKQRLITGIIFIVVVTGLIYYNSISASLLLLIITIFCTYEYASMARHRLTDPPFRLSMILGIGPIIGSWIFPEIAEGYELYILIACFGIMIIFSFATLILNIRNNHHILAPLIALLYLGLPFAAIDRLIINGDSYMKILLLGILFSLWVSDTGAYVVGRLIGRTPLHKRVSPKKTLEGLIGAGLFSVGFGFLFSKLLIEYSLNEWLIIMISGWIFGAWGDLYESSIKRRFEVKDSGNLLPGHGGFLDRFDSFIFAAPATIIILFTIYNY